MRRSSPNYHSSRMVDLVTGPEGGSRADQLDTVD
ncbi:hypothetical protein I3760_03G038400 [Carya illinoinensis]|nr:hypothetical protein I3760_03G038400 [Carya illinoinensis]